MSNNGLVDAVTRALGRVVNPATGQDVVAGGQVADVSVDERGDTRFVFSLQRATRGPCATGTSAAGAAGISAARWMCGFASPAWRSGERTPSDDALPPPRPHPPRSSRGPLSSQPPKGGLQPGSVPAPTPKPGILPGVERIVAISSGKGGVGKSMVATNLAVHAASRGLTVGLMDADIYGPNIPVMFAEERRPAVAGAKGSEMIVPLEAHGVRLMSLGFLLEREQPAIMRGPLIAGILKQFMEQVAWGRLDLMIVDMPPGTGDAQLSLVQTVDLDGAVMVTTPQKVATGDVRRGVKMFERVNTRVMGVVENMCGFRVPGTDEVLDLFGRGGGEDLARELAVPFLGRIPLDMAVREAGDEGRPTVLSAPNSDAGLALAHIGNEVLAALEGLPLRR